VRIGAVVSIALLHHDEIMGNGADVLLLAAAFAAEKHRDQRRKDTAHTPYINHPVAVAEMLARHGCSNDVELLAAALLHDTVEDTDTSLAEIERLFGPAVSGIVAEVTDDKTLEKARRKELQVETAPHKSNRAKQLKIADKICNIRDIDADSPEGWSVTRKMEYLRWAERVVEGCRGVNAALDRSFDEQLSQALRRAEHTTDHR